MKNRNLLFIIICLLTLCSCDNFLDIKPTGRVIPTTALQYRELLTQAYSIIPEDRGMASLRSDEITMDATNSSTEDLDAYKDIWAWNDYNPSGNTSSFDWRQYYQMLFIANYTIENENSITEGTKEDVDQLIGESYLMRSYVHFLLVNLYGAPYTAGDPTTAKGIPLKLNSNQEEVLSRNTVSEVYNSILSDIDKAETLINKDQWDSQFSYRFNKLSVNALRSRVYLYMGEWEKSLAASEAVLKIKSTLTDMRSSTVLPNYYNSEESILALEKVMTSSYIKVGRVSTSLLNTYGSGDQRKSKYYKAVTLSNYQVIKGGSNEFRCSFRVGEMYLNAAEAAAHIVNKDADAKNYLLTLMKYRYSTNAYAAKETSINNMGKEELITEILAERNRELAFEGHRWFDLRRTTRPRIEKTYDTTKYVLEENDSRYTIRIPTEAIENNPNLAN